jgi:hypothetical protein
MGLSRTAQQAGGLPFFLFVVESVFPALVIKSTDFRYTKHIVILTSRLNPSTCSFTNLALLQLARRE